jgi:hypothetical protein
MAVARLCHPSQDMPLANNVEVISLYLVVDLTVFLMSGECRVVRVQAFEKAPYLRALMC